MSAESLGKKFSDLEPGSLITFNNFGELSSFEDQLADEVDPNMTVSMREQWSGRIPIEDLIRPSRFYGNIKDISLTVMPDAYSRLLDARERGIRFSHYAFKRGKDVPYYYYGYILSASATSTGRGHIGYIGAELWYRYCNNPGSNGGMRVKRIVSLPQIDETAFVNLEDTSRAIGYRVLQQSISRPIITPISQ